MSERLSDSQNYDGFSFYGEAVEKPESFQTIDVLQNHSSPANSQNHRFQPPSFDPSSDFYFDSKSRFDMARHEQTTIASAVVIKGAGVHANLPVCMVLKPAPANTGIVFVRNDKPNGKQGGTINALPANWRHVSCTQLCTVLGQKEDVSVGTIEHLMAALVGLRIDNLLIEIDGSEVPIMDGSSASFIAAIDAVGVVGVHEPRRYLRLKKTVRVDNGASFAELSPLVDGSHAAKFHIDVEIDFGDGPIGRQRKILDLDPFTFRYDIARARTFGFLKDLAFLREKGLARGSSLENSVALDGNRILNPEGLRYPDEFVRHKILDAIGDLALAGYALIGQFRSHRPGHAMNRAVLEVLFADPTAYEIVTFADDENHAGQTAGAKPAKHKTFAA